MKSRAYQKFYGIVVIIFCSGFVWHHHFYARSFRNYKRCCDPSDCFIHSTIGPRLSEYGSDIIQLHANIISWDSFKIVSAVFPFFVALRMIDENLQSYFYDEWCHKNTAQMPHWCSKVAKVSIGIPITIFLYDAFFSQDEVKQRMGWIFMAGMPFVLSGKDLIKQWRFESALRPWHENFSCKERSSGGFPSGHMAEITFMTTLYGLKFGGQYALPLSILGLMVGISFVNCNRHYVSQLVAGGALGAVYGLASYKLYDECRWQHKNFSLGLSCNYANGAPVFSLAYRF